MQGVLKVSFVSIFLVASNIRQFRLEKRYFTEEVRGKKPLKANKNDMDSR